MIFSQGLRHILSIFATQVLQSSPLQKRKVEHPSRYIYPSFIRNQRWSETLLQVLKARIIVIARRAFPCSRRKRMLLLRRRGHPFQIAIPNLINKFIESAGFSLALALATDCRRRNSSCIWMDTSLCAHGTKEIASRNRFGRMTPPPKMNLSDKPTLRSGPATYLLVLDARNVINAIAC